MNNTMSFNYDKPQFKGEPDFQNLMRVLERDEPQRPSLFEFFLNEPLYTKLVGTPAPKNSDIGHLKWLVKAFQNAGYDYTTTHGASISFFSGEDSGFHHSAKTVITDRDSFDKYEWPNPDKLDYSMLEKIKPELPGNMKIIAYGPGGVLENAISLVGYEHISLLMYDAPELLDDIFEAIGSVLVRHYEIISAYPSVGACIGNDDWGFKTQTVLPPSAMRRYVIPWHKKIVKAVHAAGKPAILHSCGKLAEVYEDIIEVIGYDAKHSYEDSIQPVEEAYEMLHERIAVLGGIDVDFVCRKSPQEIYERSKAMVERTAGRGAYALGTGNSVPEYVPDEHYFAMTAAVLDQR